MIKPVPDKSREILKYYLCQKSFTYLEMKNLGERTGKGSHPRAQFQILSYTLQLRIAGFRKFEPIHIIKNK